MVTGFFKLKENGTNLRTEIIAGFTSFVAAMYIIIVNPSILSQAGMSYNAVLTATVLLSAFSSIMMGVYAKNPILVAPGMGINAYFTYSMVIGMHIPVETALGAVFWSGIIFLLLSVFRIRTMILKAIPISIRYGTAVGIGLFITLIGLHNAGFITTKAPFIGMGTFNALTLTFIAGLFITAILVVLRVKGALITGIIITTILSYPIGRWYGDASSVNFGNPVLISVKDIVSMPDFGYFFRLDLISSLKLSIFPATFGLLFTDMFDSISTFVGVAEAGNLKNKSGEPDNIHQSLVTDSFATIFGGLFGTSSGTAYIESAAGIQAGGRTGLTAVVVGLLFIPFMFLAPLAKVVPSIATAPALVIVGVYMMKPVRNIPWDEMDEAIPAFLALILIPLTYSITQGIIWGFLTYTILKIVKGKTSEIHPMLWIIDAFSILLLVVEMGLF
jgi:AGZA family xanthine/uracil permease-like MFS transporter